MMEQSDQGLDCLQVHLHFLAHILKDLKNAKGFWMMQSFGILLYTLLALFFSFQTEINGFKISAKMVSMCK